MSGCPVASRSSRCCLPHFLHLSFFAPVHYQVQSEFLCLGHQVVSAARAQGLKVSCRLTVVAPQDFHPSLVHVEASEAVAVVSWMALHALPDSSVLRHNPRDATLKVQYSTTHLPLGVPLVYCWCTSHPPVLRHNPRDATLKVQY